MISIMMSLSLALFSASVNGCHSLIPSTVLRGGDGGYGGILCVRCTVSLLQAIAVYSLLNIINIVMILSHIPVTKMAAVHLGRLLEQVILYLRTLQILAQSVSLAETELKEKRLHCVPSLKTGTETS